MIYKNIEETSDKKFLYDYLDEKALREIDDILEAYFTERIDLIVPRLDNGEIDWSRYDKNGCDVLVKDDTYKQTGHELLVLKWINDLEDTGYMAETIQSDQKEEGKNYVLAIVNHGDLRNCVDYFMYADGSYRFGPVTEAKRFGYCELLDYMKEHQDLGYLRFSIIRIADVTFEKFKTDPELAERFRDPDFAL